ncbi:MAG: GAF domain-containing protein [Candidatus Acidiferrum sp.]
MNIDIAEFSARLLADHEIIPRARTCARIISQYFPGSAVVVYLLAARYGEEVWQAKASTGEVTMHSSAVNLEFGTLGEVAASKAPLVFSGKDLPRESYSHLDIRRTVVSLGYLPLLKDKALLGAIEILGYDGEIEEDAITSLMPLAKIAAAALSGAKSYETERNESLISLTRLSQLYDIEKVFSSTLEMDELLVLIGTKLREVMECQAVNIWLLQPDERVELTHQAGSDATIRQGSSLRPGEGIAGSVSDTGESALVASAEDERLLARNRDVQDGRVASLVVVPILDKGALVGVIEAVNKMDGTLFDEDDLFVLTSMAETASTALHNAGLLLAERKVEILETLVTVSHEITSTLNLERMLQTIVNAPQAVIPYDRAAIALERRGRFKLSAVSGVTQVNTDSPDIAPLNEILQWAALSEEVIHVRQVGEEVDAEREETRAKFERYFNETGRRAFYAMPLSDDTGRVGILSLESTDPDFLSQAHIEILAVLAGQATVALRNAQMYKEVPFISVLEPVLERKRKFMAMEKKRRGMIIALTTAALIFLGIFPLPLRVDGDAVVAPAHRAQVQPEIEGVVGKVYVHEGERVTRGQVLADMEAWDYRSALAEAEAKYQTSILQVNHALAGNDTGEAGVQRVQADYWKSEVDRARELLDRTQLRSPIDGVIATPHIENAAGRRLQHGESFAEVMDSSQTVVDVAIDDVDAGLLKPGLAAVMKLNSYATKTFRGRVAVVSPKAEMQHEDRVFFARVALENPGGELLAGMEGRGKVTVGWYPAGYVLFRRPVLWTYSKLWSWFGW